MVTKEQIVPGANFRFKGGDRRVVKVENGQVHWVYADAVERFGQIGGNQRLKHFSNEAIEGFSETWADIARAGRNTGRNPSPELRWILMHVYAVLAIVGSGLLIWHLW